MNWRSRVPIAVVVLLANEIFVSLIIGWRTTGRLGPGQWSPAAAVKEQAVSNDPPRPETTATVPNATDFAPRSRDAEISEADHLKYACLSFSHETKIHHISYRSVQGSALHMASAKNPWLHTSAVPGSKPAVRPTSETMMFVPAIFDQSHCIHDLLFSLLPAASRGELRDFQAVAVERPKYHDDDPHRDWDGDYCTSVLSELRWFKNITTVEYDTCLEDLWVPAFMYRRFPRSWGKRTAEERERSKNDYIHNEDLPASAMHFFQQQMWMRFLASDNEFRYTEKKLRVVFDSRLELGRGEWTNANAIAVAVRARLDPEAFAVDVVDDVGALPVKGQAALFHSASVLVAPQGGSIGNAIFMRPHSVLIELSCGEGSWVRDWAADLKIGHAAMRADEAACKVQGYRTYFVEPPSALVDRVVDVCKKIHGAMTKRDAIRRAATHAD
ncbi:hypothetical protein ACHAWF_013224 [Thalassiosira exigua]